MSNILGLLFLMAVVVIIIKIINHKHTGQCNKAKVKKLALILLILSVIFLCLQFLIVQPNFIFSEAEEGLQSDKGCIGCGNMPEWLRQEESKQDFEKPITNQKTPKFLKDIKPDKTSNNN